MPLVQRLLVLLLLTLAGVQPVRAQAPVSLPLSLATDGRIAAGQRFVSIAFHDVVDDPAALTGDAVTTDSLVGFFDFLQATGWTAISLDDVDAARRGERALPDRAILISFDDGYASLYRRVFPLALAYRMPVVAALVGAWVDAPAGAVVAYGDQRVPREHFVTWAQVREMQASGLVEIASHSHDLHRGLLANPQGNQLPAAVSRQFSDSGYEDDAAYRQRLVDDLSRSRDLIARETGRPPRTLVWPFGRYGAVALTVAQSLGFRFALTLDPEPADAATPMALARYLPTFAPKLAEIDNNLRFDETLPSAQRLVCVDPARLWTGDAAGTDRRLGLLIERLRRLGSTAVVIDAAQRGADGGLAGAWFPNSQLPLRADLLSRLAWQLQTRAGVDTYVRLPVAPARATLGDDQRVRQLFRELGVQVPATGLLLEDVPGLLAPAADPGQPADGLAMPWQTQRLRRARSTDGLGAADQLALQAFREVEYTRPRLKLALLAAPGAPMAPAALADLTLVPVAADAASAQAAVARWAAARVSGPTDPTDPTGNARPSGPPDSSSSPVQPSPQAVNAARRLGLWLTGAAPPSAPDLRGAMRGLQVAGGTVLGWCPDDAQADAPPATGVAPDLSAASFPLQN